MSCQVSPFEDEQADDKNAQTDDRRHSDHDQRYHHCFKPRKQRKIIYV